MRFFTISSGRLRRPFEETNGVVEEVVSSA